MVEARLPTFAPTDEQAATATELGRSFGLGVNDGETASATELGRSFGLGVDDGSWPELQPEDWPGLRCAHTCLSPLLAPDRVVEGGGGSSCGACIGATAELLGTAAVVDLVRSTAVPWALAPGNCSAPPARGGSSRPALTRPRDSLPSPAPVARSPHRVPSQRSRP